MIYFNFNFFVGSLKCENVFLARGLYANSILLYLYITDIYVYTVTAKSSFKYIYIF